MEHMSFSTFVRKFDITDKETASERRAHRAADKRLLTDYAIIAKETAVIAQKASIKETIFGLERYQLEVIDDSDTDDSDTDDSDIVFLNPRVGSSFEVGLRFILA
ncbi:hypothetical protein BGZ76_003539 [Entomortierella beljakovae]|nr:hypothetical protein BGZ76_003539 [Entomortierella beljakovae]